MAVNSTITKVFNDLKGLNLRENDIVRSSEYTSEMLNVEYSETGARVKRKGIQGKSEGENLGAGLAVYAEPNLTTGAVENKLLAIGDNLWLLNKETLTINYTGTEIADVSVYLDGGDNTYYLDLRENGVSTLKYDLGKGLEEATKVSITLVLAAINALTDFSATASGVTTGSGAFLEITRQQSLNPSHALEYKIYEKVDCPLTTPFANHWARKGELNFENASTVNINGALYIANGFDDLFKYDGNRLYKAGLPQNIYSGTTIAGTLTGTFQYRVTYEYTDAKGNFIESDYPGEVTAVLSSEGQRITYLNILESQGFDATSPNLKINIWRTNDGGDIFYLLKTIVNNPASTTDSYDDDGSDALGAQFIEPIQERGLPPKGKYLAVYRGQLFITGITDDINNTRYSTFENPEYFPSNDNGFLTDSDAGDANTGIIGLSNVLYVLKDRSIYAITGDTNTNSFRVDEVPSGGVGCVAHATIAKTQGGVTFLANDGVYTLTNPAQSPTELSDVIAPLFRLNLRQYTEKKAVAVNWKEGEKYILQLPILNASDNFRNTKVDTLAFDYNRGAWLPWDTLDGIGGIAVLDGTVFLQEREFDLVAGDYRNITYQILNSGDVYDYADHLTPITFKHSSHWEHLGEPTVPKKFLRIKVHSLDAANVDFVAEAFTVDVESEINFLGNSLSSSFTLDFGVNDNRGWGIRPWGVFPWGETRAISRLGKLRQTKARSMRIVLKNNTLHQNVLISGVELEVKVPYKSTIKD